MTEIDREQAKWIALRHLGFPQGVDTHWLVSVTVGSTDTPVPGDYYARPLKPCDSCWIVQISHQPYPPSILDGGCTYVFIDQRTGDILGDVGGCNG